jgi:hypothetical protein
MFIAYTICDGKAHGISDESEIGWGLGVGETMEEAILNCPDNMPKAVCPASPNLAKAVQKEWVNSKWSIYDGVARLHWENEAIKRDEEWEWEWAKKRQAEGGV